MPGTIKRKQANSSTILWQHCPLPTFMILLLYHRTIQGAFVPFCKIGFEGLFLYASMTVH